MKERILALSLAILLAGCAAREPALPDQSAPPPEQPAASGEPVAGRHGDPALVDNPASPYPMAVERWQVDMDGDGTEELVELRAEKTYEGSEASSEWTELTGPAMRPYTLVMTQGDTVYELPLGRDSNEGPLLRPIYFPMDGDYSGTFWTEDQAGRPVLTLYFDNMSQGGAGGIDVYAVAFQNGEPAFLFIPECGYNIQATLDEETMISQVTVLETEHTETLDLMEWLANCEKRNREHGHDFTFEPIYDEDGTLIWPVAPGNIDGFYHAKKAEQGITLWQYVYGSAHVDGMGALVTTLSWEDGQPVILDQHFDWDY